MTVVFLGPRTLPGLPAWPPSLVRPAIVVGAALMIAGGGLLLAGVLALGPGLTPLPHPRERAKLVDRGPYGLVRHPMYSGGIVLAYGWACLVRGWLTLAYATALLVFLNVKASWEERRLTERFPRYDNYRRRVRKLIPFVY